MASGYEPTDMNAGPSSNTYFALDSKDGARRDGLIALYTARIPWNVHGRVAKVSGILAF